MLLLVVGFDAWLSLMSILSTVWHSFPQVSHVIIAVRWGKPKLQHMFIAFFIFPSQNMLCLIVIVIVWFRVMFVCTHDFICLLSKLLFTHKGGLWCLSEKEQYLFIYFEVIFTPESFFRTQGHLPWELSVFLGV